MPMVSRMVEVYFFMVRKGNNYTSREGMKSLDRSQSLAARLMTLAVFSSWIHELNRSFKHLGVSTRFGPGKEDGRADAGRDGRIRLARPKFQARTWAGKEGFLCLLEMKKLQRKGNTKRAKRDGRNARNADGKTRWRSKPALVPVAGGHYSYP